MGGKRLLTERPGLSRWPPGRTREAAPGLPVGARSHRRPGAEAPLPCRSLSIRRELGPDPGHGAVRSREEVVLSGRAPSALERGEEDRSRSGLVEGELQCVYQEAVTLPRLGTIRTHESTEALAGKIAEGKARDPLRHRVADRPAVVRVLHRGGGARGPGSSSATPDGGGHRSRDRFPDHGGGPPRQGDQVPWSQAASGCAGAPPPSRARPFPQKDRLSQPQEERAAAGAYPCPDRQLPSRCRAQCHDPGTRYETVVVEDLNVAGMVRNRRLARSLADQSFGTVRRQLDSKTVWRGDRLLVAERFFPSSKTCSGCGTVKAKAGRAHLPLRGLWPGHRPRREGCEELIDARRQWEGEDQRLWSRG